jgi:hypothetical protein
MSKTVTNLNGYYGDHSDLPPGLAKRNGNLPPGQVVIYDLKTRVILDVLDIVQTLRH